MNFLVILFISLEAMFCFSLLWNSGVLENRNSRVIVSAVLVAAAYLLRASMFSYETLDYQNFLAHWVDFYRSYGGVKGLKHPVGNYNIPYLYFLAIFSYFKNTKDLYLIKLLSTFFDAILARAALDLTGAFTDNPLRKCAAFFTTLFLPTVVLNGALWGQCDAVYVAMALLGISLALQDRPVLSVVCAALAFGFKLQAVFILPIYAVLFFSGKIRLRHAIAFPVTYVLLVLPAVIAGRPFLDTITLYFGQTGSIGDGLNYNSPSVYAFHAFENGSANAGIIAAFVFMFLMVVLAFVFRRRLNNRVIVLMAALFSVGIPFFLPHMHDRYFFGADILTMICGFGFAPLLFAAVSTEFASFLGYHAYLKMRYLLLMYHGARALVFSLLLLSAALIFELWNSEQTDTDPMAEVLSYFPFLAPPKAGPGRHEKPSKGPDSGSED